MKIAILTDSACGIGDIDKIDNLFLVPLMITKDDGTQIEDDESFTSEEFYKLNDSQLLKTSQSVPGKMMAKWDELLKTYDQVVCLFISKGLSGQYVTCEMLTREPQYEGKVFVADTNGVSVILKRQIEMALELLKEGKSGQEIKNEIEKSNDQFILYIIPKSLDQLVRGGRITKAAAGLAKFLKITPILKYDGIIDKHGKERTFRKAVEVAMKLLKKFGDGNKIDLSYSKTTKENLELVEKIASDLGLEIDLKDELPNTIICHTGKDTFTIAAWKKKEK